MILKRPHSINKVFLKGCIFLLVLFSQSVFSINFIDSLQIKLKSSRSDTISVKLLNQLAFELRNQNTELALHYLDSAVTLSKKNNYKTGFYDSFSLFAIIEKNKANYKSSLDYNLKALKYAEESGNKGKISSIQNNIGSVYQALGNLTQAMKYYKLSLHYENEVNNKSNQSIRLYNIGAIYEMMDSLNLASDYYYHSLQIEEELHNAEGIFYALIGLSGVNSHMKKYTIATEFLARAINIADKSGNKNGKIIAFLEQGNLFKTISKIEESIQSFKMAYIYADSIGYLNEKKVALENLASLYKQKNDFATALVYLEKFIKLKDSIASVEIQNKISELQNKYEFEKNENKIRLLEKEKKFQKLELSNRNKTIYYFLTFGIILLLILTYKIYENKKATTSGKDNIAKKLFVEKPSLKTSIIISAIAGIYFYIYSVIFEPFNYYLITQKLILFPLAYIIIVSLVVSLSLHLVQVWNRLITNSKIIFFKYLLIPLFTIIITSILIWIYNSLFGINPWKPSQIGEIISEITLVFIFPFIIILLYAENIINRQYQENAAILFEKIEERHEIPLPVETLTLVSENGKNELTISNDTLLFIKSEDNYCEIMYLQNQKVKKELMRVTLKALEEQVKSCSCMVRCHKSYLVNTKNIESISGNSLGYKLHIKFTDAEIPVSRNFPKEILSSIKSNLD